MYVGENEFHDVDLCNCCRYLENNELQEIPFVAMKPLVALNKL